MRSSLFVVTSPAAAKGGKTREEARQLPGSGTNNFLKWLALLSRTPQRANLAKGRTRVVDFDIFSLDRVTGPDWTQNLDCSSSRIRQGKRREKHCFGCTRFSYARTPSSQVYRKRKQREKYYSINLINASSPPQCVYLQKKNTTELSRHKIFRSSWMISRVLFFFL